MRQKIITSVLILYCVSQWCSQKHSLRYMNSSRRCRPKFRFCVVLNEDQVVCIRVFLFFVSHLEFGKTPVCEVTCYLSSGALNSVHSSQLILSVNLYSFSCRPHCTVSGYLHFLLLRTNSGLRTNLHKI